MKKFIVLLVISAGSIYSSSGQNDRTQILNVLEKQRQAWNRGDLEAFMKPYWRTDSLMFIGKSGVTYGWASTLENYKKGYPDTAAMGKLLFNILKMRKISPEYYFVVGKWHLTRSIGDVGGHFTLLFRKMRNTWVIVADHSS